MNRTAVTLDWTAADGVTICNLRNICVQLTDLILKGVNYEQNTVDLNNIIKVLHFFGEKCDIHDFRAEAMKISMAEYRKRMSLDSQPFGY